MGLVTVYLTFLIGRSLGGKILGYTASFIYACSFLVTFLERRLWPLSLNPLMMAVSLWLLLKVIQKDYKYLPLLAIPIGFAFHSDLSLIVMTFGIVIGWILYKFPFKRRQFIYFLTILVIFFLPFLTAEIKYDRAVSVPVLKTLKKPFGKEAISPGVFYYFSVGDFWDVLGRIVSTTPSRNIEEQICHGYCFYPKPFFSPWPQLLVLILGSSTFIVFFQRNNLEKKDLGILWIMMGSFILGILIYNRIFKGNISQNYFSVIFPVLALLLAFSLRRVFEKSKIIFFGLITLYLATNLNTLLKSSVTYPLYEKISIVKRSFPLIANHSFAVYSSPSQIDAGWTELFVVNRQIPQTSNWFEYLEWLYRAYSLIPTSEKTGRLERTVIIEKKGEEFSKEKIPIASYEYKDIRLSVFANE